MQYGRKIGFIGLGEMGKGMATNLAKKGFQTVVFDLRPKVVSDLVACGAAAAGSPRELAQSSDVIITMLRDSLQTDEVLFGRDGVWEGIRKGSVVIISSTLDPLYSRGLEQKAKIKGVHLLDAPVSGAKWASESGTLTFMVGGEEAILDECLPVFEAMGKKTFHMGHVGAGDAMKLVNNSINIVAVAVASEAITVGLKAGIDLGKMLEVINASSGSSWVVQNWESLCKMVRGRETPGIRDWNVQKDLGLGIKFANSVGERLPIAALVSQLDPSGWFPDETRVKKHLDS